MKILKKLSRLLYNNDDELRLMNDKITELEKELKGYRKLGEYDLDIHRFLADRDYLSEYEEAERKEILTSASQIYNSKAFRVVIDALMNISACHSITQAPNSEIIYFDRAGINAMKLLKDEFKRLDSVFNDMTKPEEDYDRHEIL